MEGPTVLLSEPQEWGMLNNSNEKFLVSTFIDLLGFALFTQSSAKTIKCSNSQSAIWWPWTSWWPGMNMEYSYLALGAQSDISFPAMKSSHANEQGNQKQKSDNSGPLPSNTMSESLTEMELDAGILSSKSFYPSYLNFYFLEPWNWRILWWGDEDFRF